MKIISMVAICFALLITSVPVRATSRLTDDLEELIKLTDEIVEIEILSSERACGLREEPHTIWQAKVLRCYKGDHAYGDVLRLDTMGGKINGQRAITLGQPQFKPNMIAVVFLKKVSGGTAPYTLVGGDAGEIQLCTDEEGGVYAKRICGRFHYFVEDSETLAGFRRVDTDMLQGKTFELLLRELCKSGRPVLRNAIDHTVIGSSLRHELNNENKLISFCFKLAGIIALVTGALALKRCL
jgi:hypothetical protein